MTGPLLFLDYDGVLHPDAVYLDTQNRPFLKGSGELFMWVPHLVDALDARPDIRIVLSTSWARQYGLEGAAAYLPPALRERVVASCASPRRRWLPKYAEVQNFVKSHAIAPDQWIAVDDDDYGWSHEAQRNLVLCDPIVGLSELDVAQELTSRINDLRRCE